MPRLRLENLQSSFRTLTTLPSLLVSVQGKKGNMTTSHLRMLRNNIVRIMKSNTSSLQRKQDRKKRRNNQKKRMLSIRKPKR